MCKIGDIIVIERYIAENGKSIDRHSFVVINDYKGVISGLDYDFVANVISSFKNEEHKHKKLSFEENLEITNNDLKFEKKLKKSSYVKADKLFYFNKSKITYYKIGTLNISFIQKLEKLYIKLDNIHKIVEVTSNLK